MALNRLVQSLLVGIEGEERSSFLTSVFSDVNVVGILFRSLGALEKAFVLRMLLLDRSVKGSLLAHWTVLPKPSVDQLIARLVGVGVLVSISSSDGPSYDLHANFRTTLLHRINAGGEISEDKFPPSVILGEAPRYFFASAAKQSMSLGEDSKWYHLLDRIISPVSSATTGRDIEKIISRLGFGQIPPPPAAFSFVLGTTGSQLWILIAEYVSMIEKIRSGGGLTGAAVALRIIAGIMDIETRSKVNPSMASSSHTIQVGHIFSTDQVAIRTLAFLEDLDVVRVASGGQYTLGPTADALVQGGEVVSDTASVSTSLLVGAQLLVDSNMHITAYTKSALQIKLIGLFCHVQRIIGKVLMGVLTRESVQRAIDGGVTADTIIKFLSSNTHPGMAVMGIPSNVAMQIRLWEADCPRVRLRMDPAVVLSWRNDRTETLNKHIVQIRQIAESHQALLFVKEEPNGGIHLGIKAEVAHRFILKSAESL
jgi:hypothetical protein